MKKILIPILFLTYISAAELEIGSGMPGMNYKLKDISGNTTTLADVKGNKGTLVIFSCNTCPWVIRWEDRYVSIADTYTSKGIGVIAVNSNAARFDGDDSLEEMIKHAEKNNYNFPYVQDPRSQLASEFGATKTPHIYLFDNNDVLVYRGAIDDNAREPRSVEEPFLANAIDQLLSGRSIEKPTSKAIGCSIKFP